MDYIVLVVGAVIVFILLNQLDLYFRSGNCEDFIDKLLAII